MDMYALDLSTPANSLAGQKRSGASGREEAPQSSLIDILSLAQKPTDRP